MYRKWNEGLKTIILIMEIISISTYKAGAARECPSGVSMTIPGRALSIGEICRRSVIGAQLPELAFHSPLDEGSDETFDDAFDSDFDIIDAKDNEENLGYLYTRISEQERAAKSQKDKSEVTPSSLDVNSGTESTSKPNVD